MSRLSLLIADDHELIRHGLRLMIGQKPEWNLCAEASNGRQAVEMALQCNPDIAILDVGMPELNGLEATRQILRGNPRTEVLILTMHESEQLVEDVIAAGAHGYLLKTDAARLLEPAIEALAAHQPFFTASVSRMVLHDKPGGKPLADPGQHAMALHGQTHDHQEFERDLHFLREKYGESRAAVESLKAANLDLKKFASVCAHDLREPLRMVISFIDLFVNRYGNTIHESARQYIQLAVDGARRMSDLIDDLLRNAVGIAELRHEEVDLDLVLIDTLRTFEPAIAEAGGNVHRARLPTVWGDRSSLRRVLQNLLDNALKFRSHRPLVIDVSVKELPDFWQISVSDNGIGMNADDQERVFGEFERLSQASDLRGSGLGLSICRRIIEKHGGRIWIEAVLDRGTTVHFTLPRTEKKGD